MSFFMLRVRATSLQPLGLNDFAVSLSIQFVLINRLANECCEHCSTVVSANYLTLLLTESLSECKYPGVNADSMFIT